MSRFNSQIGVQHFAYDAADAAEGLAIFFSQNGDATARFRFLVKAILDQGEIQVGEFYSSPPSSAAPLGALSRMIAGAVCPGARSWAVDVSCVGSPTIPNETQEVILASSRCYAEVGIQRVGERYNYAANAGAGSFTFTVLAGMKVTGIAAIGLTGGGSIIIGGGATITVPAGISANPEPRAPIAPNTNIVFNNVDWVVEYLESA